MTLSFRNIDVEPSAPVEDWGFEGLLAAVDRGEAADWRAIIRVVREDPWGSVARLLEDDVLPSATDSGVAGAMRTAIDLHRQRAEAAERREVQDELVSLVRRSGLTQGEFAARLGTSRTRLNSYLNGRVVPAATVLVRARRISARAA